MKRNLSYIMALIPLSLGFMGCESDGTQYPVQSQHGIYIEANINNYDGPTTRVVRMDDDDLWSYKKFNYGDVVGFYSRYGNMDAEDGNGVFENVQLVFGNEINNNRTTFFNDEINFNFDNFVEGQALYYYPYTPNMTFENLEQYKEEGVEYGFELRTPATSEGLERCNDLVWEYNPKTPSGNISFNHAFSSLVILRGEGFDKATNKTVKVKLDEGYSHVMINTITSNNASYYKYFKLIYKEGYAKSQEDCKVWEAWQGKDPYIVEDKKNPVSEFNGKEFHPDLVHYVILPTQRVDAKTNVEYIEIEDNFRKVHKITDFYLYSSTKKDLEHSQRYPLVIQLKNKEVEVSTIGIDEWNIADEITETRETGISSEEEFKAWIASYKSYLESNRNSDQEETLLKYGSRTVVKQGDEIIGAKWTFYLQIDIDDINSLIGQGNRYVIDRFEDTLEGDNHSISGLTLSHEGTPAFIGELTSEGSIRNVKFKNITLTTKSDNSELAAGGIVANCSGMIENCSVNGNIRAYGPVGMIAGEASNATISNCVVSGMVIGSSTYQDSGVVGKASGSCTIENNNNSRLVFQRLE